MASQTLANRLFVMRLTPRSIPGTVSWPDQDLPLSFSALPSGNNVARKPQQQNWRHIQLRAHLGDSPDARCLAVGKLQGQMERRAVSSIGAGRHSEMTPEGGSEAALMLVSNLLCDLGNG